MFRNLFQRLSGSVEISAKLDVLAGLVGQARGDLAQLERALQRLTVIEEAQARQQNQLGKIDTDQGHQLAAIEAQGRRTSGIAAALDDLGARLGSLETNERQQRSSGAAAIVEASSTQMKELVALRVAVANLQRSAPGRGNVTLPNNRMLTRLSLPELFPHSEPIYFVNADDKLIVPKLAMTGCYEREATEFVARAVKPLDHVIDVGANFGYYSVIFANLVGWKGKVLAFEPEARMYELLIENLAINWVETWSTAIKAACSDAPGRLRLYTSPARAANTGPSIPVIGAEFGSDFKFSPIDVDSVRIDDSLESLGGRVDFLKVDVEGGEPLVLRGARETIGANPQLQIMMEWSPDQLRAAGHDLTAFAVELSGYGLRCHIIKEGGRLEPFEYLALPERGYSNLVLAPGT